MRNRFRVGVRVWAWVLAVSFVAVAQPQQTLTAASQDEKRTIRRMTARTWTGPSRILRRRCSKLRGRRSPPTVVT